MSLTPNTEMIESTATPAVDVVTPVKPKKKKTSSEMVEALHRFIHEEVITPEKVRSALELMPKIFNDENLSPNMRLKSAHEYLLWSLGSPMPAIQINNNKNLIFNSPESQLESRKIIENMMPNVRAALADQLARRDENIRKGVLQNVALAAGELDVQIASGVQESSDKNSP